MPARPLQFTPVQAKRSGNANSVGWDRRYQGYPQGITLPLKRSWRLLGYSGRPVVSDLERGCILVLYGPQQWT